jgi:hypothetical protein
MAKAALFRHMTDSFRMAALTAEVATPSATVLARKWGERYQWPATAQGGLSGDGDP